MQNLRIFEKTTTIELINYLSEADKLGLQEYVNIFAYELACRIYVPNDRISFIEMLDNFGYKKMYTLQELEQKGQEKPLNK